MRRVGCWMLVGMVVAVLLSATMVHSENPEWVVFNTENSGLPENNVKALAIDAEGNVWVGCGYDPKGVPDEHAYVTEFDGANWTVYDSYNTELPSFDIYDLAFDAQGDLWVASYYGGLARFDGTTWTVYTGDNSGLPSSIIKTLAFDAEGSLWIGTQDAGLVEYDGVNWRVYNTENSGLPDNNVNAFAIDAEGDIWVGGGGWANFALVHRGRRASWYYACNGRPS